MTTLAPASDPRKGKTWDAVPRVGALTAPAIAIRRKWGVAIKAAVALAWCESWLVANPHRSALMRELRGRFRRIILNRFDLARDLFDRWGDRLMVAMPALLARPPKTRDPKGFRLPPEKVARDLADFDARRLDLLGSMVRVADYLVSIADFGGPMKGFVYWPGSHPEQRRPPSVKEIAAGAGLSKRSTNRALHELRKLGWLAFTKHDRDDEKWGPSMRRLDLDLIASSFDPEFQRRWEALQGKPCRPFVRKTLTGKKVWIHPKDRRIEDAVRAVGQAITPPPPLPPPSPKSTPDDRQALYDAIHAEHPDWKMAEIVDEAIRRRGGAGPPTK